MVVHSSSGFSAMGKVLAEPGEGLIAGGLGGAAGAQGWLPTGSPESLAEDATGSGPDDSLNTPWFPVWPEPVTVGSRSVPLANTARDLAAICLWMADPSGKYGRASSHCSGGGGAAFVLEPEPGQMAWLPTTVIFEVAVETAADDPDIVPASALEGKGGAVVVVGLQEEGLPGSRVVVVAGRSWKSRAGLAADAGEVCAVGVTTGTGRFRPM